MILQVFMMAVTGGAIYGAIRADIRNLHEKVGSTNAAVARAHERIDQVLRDA